MNHYIIHKSFIAKENIVLICNFLFIFTLKLKFYKNLCSNLEISFCLDFLIDLCKCFDNLLY